MAVMRHRGRLAPRPSRIAPRPKATLPFYRQPEWKELVKRLIKVRGRRCHDCGREGCRIYGDHEIELRDGGAALDERNVILRCATCHGAKTEQARRARAGLVDTPRGG